MTFIISEAGVNHNGEESLARELIEAAYSSGADCVKFQTFDSNLLVTSAATKAAYQKKNVGGRDGQLEMLKKLELSLDAFKRLSRHCEQIGIEFLSTPFDTRSLSFLVNEVGQRRLKVASGEIVNAPLLLEYARLGLPIVMSSGMATLADVEAALSVIAFGAIAGSEELKVPVQGAFREAYGSKEGRAKLEELVTLLHCTTEYPAPVDEINLRAISTLQSAFQLPVGFSDHSDGIVMPIGAVCLGASVIEKHMTTDKSLEGPDHLASLEPREFQAMVKAIRQIESGLGSGVKTPSESELKNVAVARKVLVAKTAIDFGQIITEENIAIKRSSQGMSPMNYWALQGKTASRVYAPGDVIDE